MVVNILLVRLLHTHRIEVLHSISCESISYLLGCCHTRQGMPVTHRFSHGHYIRTEVLSLQLETPEMTPHASKTCLHFICHEHSPS